MICIWAKTAALEMAERTAEQIHCSQNSEKQVKVKCQDQIWMNAEKAENLRLHNGQW